MAGLLDNEWDPYGVNIVDGTMVERMEDPTFGHPQTPPTMLYPDGIWEQTNRGQEFDEEIKVEQQAGAPDKTTTILKPKPSPAEPDLQAQGQAFNPMELWENVSAVVDAEMMTQEESNQKAQQIQTMAQGSSNAPGQSFGTPPVQPGVSADPTVPQGPQGPHMGDQSFTSPYRMPQGIQGNGPHPTNQPPPPVPAGQGFHPMEFGQVGVPQGTPPGQPPADPTAGFGLGTDNVATNASDLIGTYFGEGSQRPTFNDLQTQNRQDEAPPGQLPAAGNQQAVTDEVVFTPEEKNIMTQAGVSEADQEMNGQAIKAAATDNNGTSTVDGKDASTDPLMWEQWGNLAQNPSARKADYLKQMNMLILGGIMLDAMASAMGVQSESGKYIEAQLKMMDAAMKFDDQQHIYDLGRSVYYNEDGTYNPAKTQAEVFDRLMQSGATVAEAQAMSSKHPKSPGANGWDAYYKPREDGTIETMYVPKDTAPPGEPWTDNAANARHQTSRADEDKSTAAMKDEALVNEWNAQIQALEAEGRMEEANALRIRRDNLKNRSGMAAKVGSSDARNLFTALYKSRMGDAYSDPNYFQDPQTKQDIPFDEFYNQWLNAYELQVLDGGVLRTVPGYRKQQPLDPSQSIGQATNSEIALPGQRSVDQRLKVAQDELREQIGLGVHSPESLIKAWLASGWTPEDLPEEYR